MHDVGKIGIPDAILRKPGKAAAEESSWSNIASSEIKRVTRIRNAAGRRVLPCPIMKWDGGGCANRLSGEGIPSLVESLRRGGCVRRSGDSEIPATKYMNDKVYEIMHRGRVTLRPGSGRLYFTPPR